MGNNLRRKPYPQGYHGENRHLSNSSKVCQSYQTKEQAQFLVSSRRGTMIVLLLYEMFGRLVSSWGCNFWKVLETLGINLTTESSNIMLHFLTTFCFLFFCLWAGEASLLHTLTAVQLLPTHFPHHSGLHPLKQWDKALDVVPSWIKGTTTIQEVVIWRLILKKHRHLHRCSHLTMSSFAAYDTDRPCSLRKWLWTCPELRYGWLQNAEEKSAIPFLVYSIRRKCFQVYRSGASREVSQVWSVCLPLSDMITRFYGLKLP